MPLPNDIVLRPRFKQKIPRSHKSVLSDFEKAKTSQSDFIVNCIDDHVFIKFPKEKQRFWSPQLHLEINDITPTRASCTVCLAPALLYGPFLCFFIL